MQELSPEEDERQSQAVGQINMWCKLSETYAPTLLQDEYSKVRFEELFLKSRILLSLLTDPFYAGAARHSMINALCKAARLNDARALLAEVKDAFIREKILDDNPALPET